MSNGRILAGKFAAHTKDIDTNIEVRYLTNRSGENAKITPDFNDCSDIGACNGSGSLKIFEASNPPTIYEKYGKKCTNIS